MVKKSRPAVLNIDYDGMLEPLGQGQVLAYLELHSDHFDIHLLSFEKPADLHDVKRLAALRDGIKRTGYLKVPSAPATAFDIAVGTAAAVAIAARHRTSFVRARSYIPALIGLAVKRLTGATLLFDMRRLWADERVDGDLWPRAGKLYLTTKATVAETLFSLKDGAAAYREIYNCLAAGAVRVGR